MTTDISATKCMCLCIKYSSKKKTEITMEYLGIVELADCDAISLHRKLKNFLEEVGLPFNNLIRLGVDRASNWIGKHKLVSVLLKKDVFATR